MSYELQKSADGSYTLYSKAYGECYHSLQDGAFKEALYKHVIPAFTFVTKKHLRILDICFGLGINTLATLYYMEHFGKIESIEIFSPELDSDLLKLLPTFVYPKELAPYRPIVESVVEHGVFEDEKRKVELFIGDARSYVKKLSNIDIVYQDPFSPTKNPLLWTVEYFEDIVSLLCEEGIVTTYSVATPIRLAMDEAGLKVYEYKTAHVRRGTIASKADLPLPRVDMRLKRQRSSKKALRDVDFC